MDTLVLVLVLEQREKGHGGYSSTHKNLEHENKARGQSYAIKEMIQE